MGRPRVALISKRAALEAAIDIIDTDGLDALSIRRIAERLNVNGASLYYHFKNKDDIIVGAAKLALEDVRVPQGREEPWRVWVVGNARRVRAVLCAHPDLAPVMLRREPLGIGTAALEAAAAMLEEEGVPVGAVAPILEALELHAIGSALHEAGTYRAFAKAEHSAPTKPGLKRAFDRRTISPDEIFDVVCNQIIDTMLDLASQREQ